MAETEKKKYKGGPSRKSYIRSMASQGKRSGEYSKYGDVKPKLVHEGDATYRGATKTDTDPIVPYSVNVFRGHGKEYFIHRGVASGSSPGGTLWKSDGGAYPAKVII